MQQKKLLSYKMFHYRSRCKTSVHVLWSLLSGNLRETFTLRVRSSGLRSGFIKLIPRLHYLPKFDVLMSKNYYCRSERPLQAIVGNSTSFISNFQCYGWYWRPRGTEHLFEIVPNETFDTITNRCQYCQWSSIYFIYCLFYTIFRKNESTFIDNHLKKDNNHNIFKKTVLTFKYIYKQRLNVNLSSASCCSKRVLTEQLLENAGRSQH